MWQDPTDLTRRKPRRLRGTPANRVVNILSIAFVGTFCLLANWYTSTDAEWVLRRRERLLKKIWPTAKEEVRRETFKNAFLNSAVITLNEKEDVRLYGPDPDEEI